MVIISPPFIADFGGETGLKSPTSDFHSFRTKFCSEFFKNSYLPCLLVYKKVKDSFGKLTLSTFQWLTFHRRLSPISAVKPVWNRRLMIFPSSFFRVLKNSYLTQFLSYNNVKDSFGMPILNTFPWLQFHRP